jgi:hypothetical protein
MLDFDHREPVARGGEATAENLRLVCRAHNQYAAECSFGAGFMERKRDAVRAARRRAAPRAERRSLSNYCLTTARSASSASPAAHSSPGQSPSRV